MLTAPRSLVAAVSSVREAFRFPQYQQTYNSFREGMHTRPDLKGSKQLSPLNKAILREDRVSSSGMGKTAVRLGEGIDHLKVGRTNKKGRTSVETNTMLMMESPAFASAGKLISSKIKHQEMVLKRKVDQWSGTGTGLSKGDKPRYEYTVLAGTDKPRKIVDKQEWKTYKAQFEKVGRVRINPNDAAKMHSVYSARREAKLETDPSQPKLAGHSFRFLTEYARLNVCQTHTRDTIDKTLGAKTTDRLTSTFGFSTQGRRTLG